MIGIFAQMKDLCAEEAEVLLGEEGCVWVGGSRPFIIGSATEEHKRNAEVAIGILLGTPLRDLFHGLAGGQWPDGYQWAHFAMAPVLADGEFWQGALRVAAIEGLDMEMEDAEAIS